MKHITVFCMGVLILIAGCSAAGHMRGSSRVQTGVVEMPHRDRPTGDVWTVVYQTQVEFPDSYASPPEVQLAIMSIEAYSERPGTFYRLEARNVTQKGFELRILGAYMRSFSNCRVAWTALGGP